MPTMEVYENVMTKALTELKKQGISHSVFGDIFLEDLRKYREDQLAKIGFEGVFPIWKTPTTRFDSGIYFAWDLKPLWFV